MKKRLFATFILLVCAFSLFLVACKDKEEDQTPTITAIEATSLPTKLDYYQYDSFVRSGLVVTATFSDDTKRELDFGSSEYVVVEPDMSQVGTQEVVVSTFPTDADDAKTTSFEINITELLMTDVQILTDPIKVDYVKGDSFDASGLTLNVVYNSGTTEVAVYSASTADDFLFSLTQFDEAGTFDIRVDYKGFDAQIFVSVTVTE